MVHADEACRTYLSGLARRASMAYLYVNSRRSGTRVTNVGADARSGELISVSLGDPHCRTSLASAYMAWRLRPGASVDLYRAECALAARHRLQLPLRRGSRFALRSAIERHNPLTWTVCDEG